MADAVPVSLQALAPWGAVLPDPQRLMTADELLHDSAYERGYELVEGRLIKMSPTGGIHGRATIKIGAVLLTFVDAHQLGAVYGADTGFVIARNPDTVLAPDVAFVRAEHVPADADAEGFIPYAPDLAVEVASPSQFRPGMAKKAQDWLAAGTQLVWIVWPKAQQIDVWRPGQPMLTVQAGDSLDGYTVLPGFTHPVKAIFS